MVVGGVASLGSGASEQVLARGHDVQEIPVESGILGKLGMEGTGEEVPLSGGDRGAIGQARQHLS